MQDLAHLAARLGDQRLDRRALDREEADQVLGRRQRDDVLDALVVGERGLVGGYRRVVSSGGVMVPSPKKKPPGFWRWRFFLDSLGELSRSLRQRRGNKRRSRRTGASWRAISRFRILPQNHLGAAEERDPSLRCASFVTTASHTWVVRPRCTGVARHRIAPSRAVPRKLAFSSMVVKPFAPSGSARHAAVAAARVGERDDRGRVQVAVRRHHALVAPPCGSPPVRVLTVRISTPTGPGR